MPNRRGSDPPRKTSRRRPATTPEGRENQLISLAHDLAEERLRNGTASAQEVTHFLKLGSSRERLEQQRLSHENELTRVKIEALEQQSRIEDLYARAIGAMQKYQTGEQTEAGDEYDG